MVTMKANDTLHISELGPHSIAPGATFEVSEADAKDLAKRGLATQVGKAAGKNAGAAPRNKNAGRAPANKATEAKSPLARIGK